MICCPLVPLCAVAFEQLGVGVCVGGDLRAGPPDHEHQVRRKAAGLVPAFRRKAHKSTILETTKKVTGKLFSAKRSELEPLVKPRSPPAPVPCPLRCFAEQSEGAGRASCSRPPLCVVCTANISQKVETCGSFHRHRAPGIAVAMGKHTPHRGPEGGSIPFNYSRNTL